MMRFNTLSLLLVGLAAGTLASARLSSFKHHRPKGRLHRPQKPAKKEFTHTYHGPGAYYILNQATGTAMDLYLGDAGPGTMINGYTAVPNNTHQIWQVVAAEAKHQVMLINTATGAMASCPTEPNEEDTLYQMIGGQVAVDGYWLFTMILNQDKSVQFQNVGDSDLCIDLQGPSKEDDTPIICYACHPDQGKNQNWLLVPQSQITDDSEDQEPDDLK